MVDDQSVDRRSGRFEFQGQLLLHGGEDIERAGVILLRIEAAESHGAEVAAFEAGFIEDVPASVVCQAACQLDHRHRPDDHDPGAVAVWCRRNVSGVEGREFRAVLRDGQVVYGRFFAFQMDRQVKALTR